MSTLDDDRQTIRDAMVYRSGADSCNSLYMGSMATAGLYHILNVKYGGPGFEEALQQATREQLDKMLERSAGIIRYMAQRPMRVCPHCHQVMPAEGS